MAFEELDADTANFFQTGKLAESLLETPPEEVVAPKFDEPKLFDEPVDDPVVAPAKVEEAAQTETPAPNPYLERLLQEADAKTRQLQEELKALKSKVEAPPEEADIDPATDPLGALMQQQRKIQAQIAAMKEEQTAERQQTHQLTQQEKMMQIVTARVADFEKAHPDYPEAYKHVMTTRTEEYRIRGMSEQEIEKALGDEANQIVVRAMQSGKNPAEVVYTLAKKYGYAVPADTKAPAKPNPVDTIDRIRKGQAAANTTLQRAAPPTEVSAENLKEMSDSELTRAVMNDWDKMFGREKGFI